MPASVITCGRPLGMRKDPFHPRIIVADAYLGIYAVSLQDRTNITKIFPSPDYKNDFKVTFFNDVEIISDGIFAVSESSTVLPYHKLMNTVLEASGTGRVYLVDTKLKHFKILAENLAFPNGLQLLKDGTTLIVAETTRHRILTIDLQTLKVGSFNDRIPGMPDNIRPSVRGGYWVGFACVSHADAPSLFYRLRHWPLIRWAAHKLIPAGIIHTMALQRHGISIRISEAGRVLESLQGVSVPGLGTVEVLELQNGTLFFSSYYLPHLRRLHPSAIHTQPQP
ncbi:hypothetical protein Ciccas_010637 [Cichlidogyrus casuarinus]|uniref:Strictosidine synthase conserved region domain-containing protein n=1 Tax=Cichlidogyrus casuarinus TaxID=1844966 RepID=A0ABD2PY86_9PLAT